MNSTTPTDNNINCPHCNQSILKASIFCPFCGKKLQEPAPSFLKQMLIYAVSFLLPPLGLVWGLKYFRQADPELKKIALISTLLTFVSLILNIWVFSTILGSLTQSLNSQVGGLGISY